ncbi:RING finger protein 11-like isoform X1 [Tachysurus ichikawai]
MGNCLKSPTSDDISLLHESQSDRASFGDGTDPDLEPPPPYQVRGLYSESSGESIHCELKRLFKHAVQSSCSSRSLFLIEPTYNNSEVTDTLTAVFKNRAVCITTLQPCNNEGNMLATNINVTLCCYVAAQAD